MPSLRSLATVATVAVLGLALTGCDNPDAFVLPAPTSEFEEEHFDAYDDAPTTGQLKFAMPSFVPKDAEDIDVRLRPNTDPGYLIRFTSESGYIDRGCSPVDDAPEPAITADWWPDEVSGEVVECTPKRFTRPIYVAESDGVVYGWAGEDE